jgi:hypothetical protein
VLAVFGAINSYQVSRNYSAQFPDLYGGERAQSRFAPLLPQVPESAEVGYITDLDPSQQVYASALLAAQYAVAPRLVVMIDARTRPEWAVGNFSKPQDFAAAGDARGYAMVQDFGNGVVLFRRKS